MSKSKIYLPLLVLGTAFWGISFPLSKNAFESITPHTFMFYRFLIAAIILILIFHKQVFKINKAAIKKGLVSGIFLFMGICLQTQGLQYTSSSNASFIAGIEVVLIPVFAFLFLKKSIQPKMWLACILALTGLYIIAMASGFSNFKTGDLMVFTGSLFYSTYVLYVSQASTNPHSKVDAIPFVIVQLFVCAVSSGILAISTQGIAAIAMPLSPELWKALLFVGVLSTAYMYCIQNAAQKYISAEKVALTYLCEPVFATIFAYFLLDEEITGRTIVGGTFILFAMFISEVNLVAIYRKIKAYHAVD